MLKIADGLEQKLKDKDGLWNKEIEHGFYIYINKNNEVDLFHEQGQDTIDSYGYRTIWVGPENMGKNLDDVFTYVCSNMSTLDVERTIKNLIWLNGDDLYNDIVCAFDTTNKEIIVSSPGEINSFNGRDGVHMAYENLKDAPIIRFRIEKGVITEAW